MDINKAIIIGRLGKDPETRYTASGTAVCNFSVATSEVWKDKGGNKQTKTTWHNIIVWNKLAEICAEYLKKGAQVYVEGKIGIEEWEKNGTKHVKPIITASNVTMLGGGNKSNNQGTKQSSGGYDDHGAADDDFIPEEDDVPL